MATGWLSWRSWLLALVSLLLASCAQTSLIRVDRAGTPLPPPRPRAAWKAEVHDALALYERAPVLTRGDEHLEPMYGGISTLSYYSADLEQKLVDQRLDPRARGGDLQAACAASAPPGATDPLFSRTWIPVALRGGAPPADASCGVEGEPSGEHLCLFARVALQASSGADLVVVVPGLFDSSAQRYVLGIAETLYTGGYSVAIVDMRDHGDTWRSAPSVPLALGAAEGLDILHVAAELRSHCAGRVGRLGAIGVSGGGLDVIRAYAADGADGADRGTLLDAGVLALSPLLDVAAAMSDVGVEKTCTLTEAVELQATDLLAITGMSAGAFASGALLSQVLAGDGLDGNIAWSAAAGAALGLLAGVVVDAALDGSDERDCIAVSATGRMFRDLLAQRARSLLEQADRAQLGAADRRRFAAALSLEEYLMRAQAYYTRLGVGWSLATPSQLARLLRDREQSGRSRGRLLIVGAKDDPVTRFAALHALEASTRGLANALVTHVSHGGHGAM